MPTFSLHTVSGKNQVLVEYCDRILITEGELKKLSEFVQFAYGPESLNIIPEWYNASPTTSHGYAIAPVTEHKIDWEFVEVGQSFLIIPSDSSLSRLFFLRHSSF